MKTNQIKLGIINPGDLSKGTVTGGSTGFVKTILPYLNVKRTIIFGIGENDSRPWKTHFIESNVEFIPICNLKYSLKIPMRLKVFISYIRHRKKILNSGIDVLYVQMPECCPSLLNNNRGIPVIYHKHGSANPVDKSRFFYGRTFLFQKLFDIVLKFIYKKAEWIIAIDRLTFQKILKHRGNNRSSLLMNAVDTEKFFPNNILRSQARKHFSLLEDDLAIIFVGRIEKTKGPERLLDCIPYLKKTNHSFKIFFAGQGTYKLNLEKCAMTKHNEANVTFLGHVTYEKLSYFYNMADVLVLPSETEGVPMVILEALACGTPVVASNVGGIPDIVVDGINGIVIDDLSPEKLTSAIIEIISKKFGRQEIAKSVEPLSVKNFVKSFDIILSNVLRK
jgi:glycosyltransferase involved in cell wall biosynthesis